MKISIEDTGVEPTAVVSGEVDADNCLAFSRQLIDAGRDRGLVANLSALTFIDSSGISELLRVRSEITSAGHRFVVHEPSVPVRRVLEITGLLDIFGLDEQPNGSS